MFNDATGWSGHVVKRRLLGCRGALLLAMIEHAQRSWQVHETSGRLAMLSHWVQFDAPQKQGRGLAVSMNSDENETKKDMKSPTLSPSLSLQPLSLFGCKLALQPPLYSNSLIPPLTLSPLPPSLSISHPLSRSLLSIVTSGCSVPNSRMCSKDRQEEASCRSTASNWLTSSRAPCTTNADIATLPWTIRALITTLARTQSSPTYRLLSFNRLR